MQVWQQAVTELQRKNEQLEAQLKEVADKSDQVVREAGRLSAPCSCRSSLDASWDRTRGLLWRRGMSSSG
eukprot:167021-Hanusia_phi.AAC.2